MDNVSKLVILGSTGMLGQALSAEGRRRGHMVLGAARSGTDVSVDVANADELAAVLVSARPDIVVNCAAMTNVDDCERDPGRAYLVNARAASVLSETAGRVGSYLIQISTDHYYSGDGTALHSESDRVTLLNEYARTKYAGEQFALTNPGALIVRTNIVGLRGRQGNPTFVEWVIRMLEQRLPMTLFDDYHSSSIDVRQFSSALYDLVPARPRGVLNIAARQVSSKREFVRALGKSMRLPTAHCETGSVRALPGAMRAESLGLDVSKAEQLLDRPLPDLSLVVESLVREFRNTV